MLTPDQFTTYAAVMLLVGVVILATVEVIRISREAKD